MRGWHGQPYRHSLAARGIQTDDIYRSIHVKSSKIGMDTFENYRPVGGEIYSLKLLVELMDTFDGRAKSYNSPYARRESPAMYALVKETMKRMDPTYFKDDEFLNEEFEKVKGDIRSYELTGQQYKLMMAINRILFVLHRSPLSVLHFMGRDVPELIRKRYQYITSEIELDRFWGSPEGIMEFEEIVDDEMIGWLVVEHSLSIQRKSDVDMIGIGEGQEILRSWIDELERRRLT